MAVANVSSLSNDHAVATEAATARQIEILRRPAALLYGSGTIARLGECDQRSHLNRITKNISGKTEACYNDVDNGRSTSLRLDDSAGEIGWHLDGNWRDTDNYKIPGHAHQNDADPPPGRSPSSLTHKKPKLALAPHTSLPRATLAHR